MNIKTDYENQLIHKGDGMTAVWPIQQTDSNTTHKEGYSQMPLHRAFVLFKPEAL